MVTRIRIVSAGQRSSNRETAEILLDPVTPLALSLPEASAAADLWPQQLSLPALRLGRSEVSAQMVFCCKPRGSSFCQSNEPSGETREARVQLAWDPDRTGPDCLVPLHQSGSFSDQTSPAAAAGRWCLQGPCDRGPMRPGPRCPGSASLCRARLLLNDAVFLLLNGFQVDKQTKLHMREKIKFYVKNEPKETEKKRWSGRLLLQHVAEKQNYSVTFQSDFNQIVY